MHLFLPITISVLNLHVLAALESYNLS